MNIEEVIRSDKMQLSAKTLINIMYTSRTLEDAMADLLKSYKLSSPQFNVLRILRGKHPNPVSINTITDRMIDKMSNASRLVEKLRKKTMILRQTCNTDKRQVDVCITTKGLEILAEIDALMGRYEQQFAHLDQSEVSIANKVLDDLRKNNK